MPRKTIFVRLFFIAVFGVMTAGSVTMAPTSAQQTQCCTSARQPIVTSANNLWEVQPPGGVPVPAALLNTIHPGWHAAIGQSHWIGHVASASDVTQPSGNYTFVYHFCQCNVPKGMQYPAATMSLSILADDGFIVYLNSSGPIAQSGNAFINPTTVTIPSSAFIPGWNTLKIVVVNTSMVTGLDVSGWISGFFAQCVLTRPGVKPVPPAQRRRPPAPEPPT